MTSLQQIAADFGWVVRKARKDHYCDCRNARGNGTGACKNMIKAGECYVEGEMDPHRAGGYGRERYCAECCKLMAASNRVAA